METEHTKPSNEHVKKNHEDGIPLLEGKNRDDIITSPIPPHEPNTDSKILTHNPSSTPQAEENLSSASYEPTPPMKSPTIQTMGQAPPGYDPNRIPSTIFSTKPSNPTEWSVASNESLFSIHMGNNSFSRDYTILFGKSGDLQDLHASQHGELPRLDEWNNNNSQSKSNELISLPPVIESPSHEESHVSLDEHSGIEKKDKGEKSPKVGSGVKMEKHEKENEVFNVVPDVRKVVPVETSLNSPSSHLEKHEKEKPVHGEVVNNSPGANRTDFKKAMPAERMPSNPVTFPSPPRFSDVSGNSGSSFAFPVLVGENGKPESLKVVPEKPEPPVSQAQDSKDTPNASETRWFSFFLCWPRFC